MSVFMETCRARASRRLRRRYGVAQVQRWRRGFSERPPAVAAKDDRYPGLDGRYRDVPESLLPKTESLQDTQERVLPFWQALIGPELEKGKNVLVVSHGNTIRALVKHLENISDQEIEKVEIATAQPLVYELDDQMRIVCRSYLGSERGRKNKTEFNHRGTERTENEQKGNF